MHQIEALPIKNICLAKTWVTNSSEPAYPQTNKHKNSKNFLFMRVVHQNRKNRKLSTPPLESQKAEGRDKLVRPKTSLLKYQDVE